MNLNMLKGGLDPKHGYDVCTYLCTQSSVGQHDLPIKGLNKGDTYLSLKSYPSKRCYEYVHTCLSE